MSEEILVSILTQKNRFLDHFLGSSITRQMSDLFETFLLFLSVEIFGPGGGAHISINAFFPLTQQFFSSYSLGRKSLVFSDFFFGVKPSDFPIDRSFCFFPQIVHWIFLKIVKSNSDFRLKIFRKKKLLTKIGNKNSVRSCRSMSQCNPADFNKKNNSCDDFESGESALSWSEWKSARAGESVRKYRRWKASLLVPHRSVYISRDRPQSVKRRVLYIQRAKRNEERKKDKNFYIFTVYFIYGR